MDAPTHRPIIYGHRGARAHARENTVAAYALAIEHGADGVELDVRRSRDGAIIIHHEDRAEPGAPTFISQDLSTIRAATPWVPTLDEAWMAIGDEALLNVEIKNDIDEADFDQSRRIAADVVRWVESTGESDRILISSFDGVALAAVRDRAPDLATGLLAAASVHPMKAIEWAKRDGHVSVNLSKGVVLEDPAGLVSAAEPLRLMVWTVNDPADAVALAEGGVDALFSDDPALMVKTFAEV